MGMLTKAKQERDLIEQESNMSRVKEDREIVLWTLAGIVLLSFVCFTGFLAWERANDPTHIAKSSIRIKPRGPFYKGPQTVEAVMKEFDRKYGRVDVLGAKIDISEMDARYPRAEWVQHALDIGIRFKDYSDYSAILNARNGIFFNPAAPPPSYIDALIIDAVNMNEEMWEMIEKDPEMKSGNFKIEAYAPMP